LPISHLFVSHSTKDAKVAAEVVRFLEARGLNCWISSRDVLPGQNYQEAIVKALESASGFIFLFSERSSQSGEIKKELSIATSINVPVFPVRLSPIMPAGALRYELATRQWIDIFPNRAQALGKLAETIKRTIAGSHVESKTLRKTPRNKTSRNKTPPEQDAPEQDAPEQDAPEQDAPEQDAPEQDAPLHRRIDPPAAAPTAPAARTPIIAAGTAEFEAVRTLLAKHIGPIAKVYVERAASQAPDSEAFCELLAAHVSAPSDRAAFLRAARAQLMAKS
jgi:hypothetical protein